MVENEQAIRILDRYADVAPFVGSAITAADSDKNALGFFPAGVFEDFARKEQLFIAVERNTDALSYVGHLLFEARHPKGRVLQMFVRPAFRKRGIATLLLSHLKQHLTDHAFISLYARVAEDLTGANRFWGSQGFYVQSIARGGETRNRTILVRSHELDTPQLFASSGVSASDPLGLCSTSPAEVPLFLLDLNVLFDLGPRRSRNEQVLDLFKSERAGSCQLALSTEITAELERTATVGVTDPMLAYARIFPSFPAPVTDESETLSADLASIVFPERQCANALSRNDLSDLRHLATAVYHRLTGLITNDGSILNAAAELSERYGIQVVSPAAFKTLNTGAAKEQLLDAGETISLSLTAISRSEEPAVHRLLSQLDVPVAAVVEEWAAVDSNDRVSNRYGVWSKDSLIGYVTWSRAFSPGIVNVRAAVDERQAAAASAARLLLGCVVEQATVATTSQIRLNFPKKQAQIREIAAELGFGGLADDTWLTKLAVPDIITPANWTERAAEIFTIGRVRLPDSAPAYRSIDQQIRVVRPDGNVTYVPLMALETLLSPSLFCLPGRPAVVTPVRRAFAEHLLAHSPQKSLLPHARAQLYNERHYVSGAATLKQFKRGNLILFYESGKGGGIGAIVAIARVKHAYLKSQDAMKNADLDPSVLDTAGLQAIGESIVKTVAAFDNIVCLERPVPRATLEKLGCGSATQLLTTRAINETQLMGIIQEGFAYGTARTYTDLS
ncbi:GNAT family N-acetyltransferase [Burkholderia sp. WSM2230]|uniref:GNAT family N-acetyltransferase n=1 Tax=Burkholderia sp. WSM2230 TaxID=944435 RepID=UPI00055301F9|nr:GNAT family N-acetyltransferase [Burkholderia sp. WSM2230]